MVDDTNERRKWADLLVAEPRLAVLDSDARTASADPDHCALRAWYGPGGFKRRLCELVGWSRRSAEWHTPIPARKRMLTGSQLLQLDRSDEPARVAALGEDIAHGVDWLWSSATYDLAYRHLLETIGDCAEGGSCECWA